MTNAAKTKNKVAAAACFMCHEVAEKSLKAGMYAKRGVGEVSLNNHNLVFLARALVQLDCPVSIQDAKFLEVLFGYPFSQSLQSPYYTRRKILI